MDDIDRQLTQLLCTKVGMLMEDHSAQALTFGDQTEDGQKVAISELANASTKIATLVAAAQSIAE